MLRGGIVGAGFFARHHIEAWRRVEGVEIVGIADVDANRAESFRELWRLPRASTSLAGLLDDQRVDFVDIVTRPNTHVELAALALGHSTHVICQKPLAPTWAESVRLSDLARASTRRLIAHDNWRWQPWYRWARERIEAGAIGVPWHARVLIRVGDGRSEAPYPRQPYFREMPELLVFETLVHYLDTLRFLFGRVESVCCTLSRRNPRIAGEDCAIVTLRHASGATATIDAMRVRGAEEPPLAFGAMTVEGEAGEITIDPQGFGQLRADAGLKDTFDPSPHRLGYRGDSVRAAQAHYAACLATGSAAETEVDSYLETVAAVFACYESARRGRHASVPCSR